MRPLLNTGRLLDAAIIAIPAFAFCWCGRCSTAVSWEGGVEVMSKVARFVLVGVATLVIAGTLAGVATVFVEGLARFGFRGGPGCDGGPSLTDTETMQLVRIGDAAFGCIFDLALALLVAVEAVAWRPLPRQQVAEWIVPQRTTQTLAIELCLAVVVGEKIAFTVWTTVKNAPSELAALSYVRFAVTAATLVLALVALALRGRHSWKVAALATFVAAALDCGALFLPVRFPASIGLAVLPVSLALIIRTKPYRASPLVAD